MTKGTLKAYCKYLLKMKGNICPRCKASDDGPRPVYKKKGGKVLSSCFS